MFLLRKAMIPKAEKSNRDADCDIDTCSSSYMTEKMNMFSCFTPMREEISSYGKNKIEPMNL